MALQQFQFAVSEFTSIPTGKATRPGLYIDGKRVEGQKHMIDGKPRSGSGRQLSLR